MYKIKKEDSSRLAIVVVGYNRLRSINRLLDSLLSAKYSQEVPLFISIDCSNNKELYKFVEDFTWPYGNKYVRIQQHRLGLKEHIYQCGDLTNEFRGIVLLEDDIYVSPFFYSYALQAMDKYENDEDIAQIALYRNEIVGQVKLPFEPMPSSSDVFLMQAVSTWGECWSASMWKGFREWLQKYDDEIIEKVDMPSSYKRWTKAWSKYYNAYILDTNKYVLYPYFSLSTNFNEAGEHASISNSSVQVVLQQSDFNYRMDNATNLIKYDIYRNNAFINQWLQLPKEDVILDIYGYHPIYNKTKYILSSKILPLAVERKYAAKLRPIELNIKYGLEGNGIFLYKFEKNISKQRKYKFSDEFIAYYLNRFNSRTIIDYLKSILKKRLFGKRQ